MQEQVKIIDKFFERTEDNIEYFKKLFKNDDTLRIRRFASTKGNTIRFCAMFFDGMVEGSVINLSIIKPAQMWKAESLTTDADYVSQNVMQTGEIEVTDDTTSAIKSMMNGDTIIFVDGDSRAEKRKRDQRPERRL